MIQDKMVRARRQYHHHQHHHHQQQQHNNNNNNGNNNQNQQNANSGSNNHHNNHRHAPLNHHFHRHSSKRSHVPSAPSNTTQFIMNDHELIEPDFDLMHNAIMEHYNRSKKRKHQNENDQGDSLAEQRQVKRAAHENYDEQSKDSFKAADENDSTKTLEAAAISVTTTPIKSPRKGELTEESKNHQLHQNQMPNCRHQTQQQTTTNTTTITTTSAASTTMSATTNTQLQESTNQSNPTTPSYRPTTGSPGDEDGLSPFINHEHLQSSEFQEVYANIHTERLSSMSKNQLVDQYLLLEERVEKLENQLRESQTATASAANHG